MSRDDKIREEIGTGLVILLIFVLLFLVAIVASAQEKSVPEIWVCTKRLGISSLVCSPVPVEKPRLLPNEILGEPSPISQEITDTKKLPEIPLPPDITHVHHVGCHIDAHHSEPPIFVLNAKTGEEEESVMWWVTPFAKYVDLPSGEKREDWEPKDPIGKYPGTTSDMNGASVACGQWMAKEKAAQKKEMLSEGHNVKK